MHADLSQCLHAHARRPNNAIIAEFPNGTCMCHMMQQDLAITRGSMRGVRGGSTNRYLHLFKSSWLQPIGHEIRLLTKRLASCIHVGMCTEYESTWSDLSQLPTDLLVEALTETAPNQETHVCWASFRLVCRDWRHTSSMDTK